MVRQQLRHPVSEHLVIELAKVDQPVLGLGLSGDPAIMGGTMGAVPSTDAKTHRGRGKIHTQTNTVLCRTR